jgi:hypothetical protein
MIQTFLTISPFAKWAFDQTCWVCTILEFDPDLLPAMPLSSVSNLVFISPLSELQFSF